MHAKPTECSSAIARYFLRERLENEKLALELEPKLAQATSYIAQVEKKNYC